jgi:hypothetical protein
MRLGGSPMATLVLIDSFSGFGAESRKSWV